MNLVTQVRGCTQVHNFVRRILETIIIGNNRAFHRV